MDVLINITQHSADVNPKMDDGHELQPHFSGSQMTISESSDVCTAGQTDTLHECNMHPNIGKSRGARAASESGSVQKHQPETLRALLTSSNDTPVSYEVSSEGRGRLQTTAVKAEPSDKDDVCASVILACLLCNPLDCVLATVRGCSECVQCLCWSLCDLESTPPCTSCCLLCDCEVRSVCPQFTECLDLAMEISQMIYH